MTDKPKMNRARHHQNFKSDWETPPELFKLLDARFHFTLDVCAVRETAKCPQFFSPKENALVCEWDLETCWMNPPYGVGVTEVWVEKAIAEAREGATVVALLPANTSSAWFAQAFNHAAEVIFLVGRVAFLKHKIPVLGNTGGSVIMVFRPPSARHGPKVVTMWHWRREISK